MSWSSVLDNAFGKAKDILKGTGEKAVGQLGDALSISSAPVGLVFDIARMAGADDKLDSGPWKYLSAKRSAGSLGDTLVGEGSLTGWAISGSGKVLDSAYRNAIENPVESLLYTTDQALSGDPVSWSKAWGLARDRNLGQTLQLTLNDAMKGTHLDDVPGFKSVSAPDGSNISATDKDAWKQFSKDSPFLSGATASLIDIEGQFIADPGIAAVKLTKPLRDAHRIAKGERGFDDLIGTVKFEDKSATKTTTVTDDFGSRVRTKNPDDGFIVDDFGQEVPRAVVATVDKPGRMAGMSETEIYYGMGLNRNVEQGPTIAHLLHLGNQMKDPAIRVNTLRDTNLVLYGGDLNALKRLGAQPESAKIADTLSNAFLARQSGTMAAAVRDAENADKIAAGTAAHAFNSADVLGDTARQLENDDDYVEVLHRVLEGNPLRVTSKGERAIARLNDQGMGRDGTLHTGFTKADRAANRAKEAIARTRAGGVFKSSGSFTDEALAGSKEFDRPLPLHDGTDIVPEVQTVTRGPFQPAVVVGKGIRAAGWATVTPYSRLGYKASDALRGRVVHGALNVEKGNEALNIEVARSYLQRAGASGDELDRYIGPVIAATNPSDRFRALDAAFEAGYAAVARKHGLSEDVIRELGVRKTRAQSEMRNAIQGQRENRFTSRNVSAIADDNPNEVRLIPADMLTMADEGGVIHVPLSDDLDALTAKSPVPIFSTQTPNNIMVPDVDFIDRQLSHDKGALGAYGKMRDFFGDTTKMNALRAERDAMGLSSTRALRSRNAAQEWLFQAAEDSNNNWKRAILLSRAVPFAIRNTTEEELRIWASGMQAAVTHEVFRNARHAMRESKRLRNPEKFDPHTFASRELLTQEHALVEATHNDPKIRAEVNQIHKRLKELRAEKDAAVASGDLASASRLDGPINLYEQHPALLEDVQRKADMRQLNSSIKDLTTKMTTKTAPASGTRTVRGVEVPDAFAGKGGNIQRILLAEGGSFDDETTGAAGRMMSRLRAVGEDVVIKAPSSGAPSDVAARHLEAWSHILNYQVRNAPEAMVGLDALAHGATRDEAVDVVHRWLNSKAGREVRASNTIRSHDTHAWASEIVDTTQTYVPDTALARSLVNDEVAVGKLGELYPDQAIRPDLHMAGVGSLSGSQGRKMDVLASKMFKKINDLSLTPMTRHPMFQARFHQEQDRLAGEYIDKVRAVHGDDAMISVDEIEKLTERSRRIAEKDVKEAFYDTTSRSYAAERFRFVYPFFAAHQDSMAFWGKSIAADPSVLRKLQIGTDIPSDLGLVVDQDGKPITGGAILEPGARLLIQMPKAWGGPDPQDPHSRGGRFSVSLQSFNLLMQNGSILNPGAGPLASLPAGWVQRKWGAGDEDVSKAMRWFNPYGAPLGDGLGDSLFGAVGPTPIKRAKDAYDAFVSKDSATYNKIFGMYMKEELVKFSKDNDRPPDNHETNVLLEKAAGKVKIMSLVRFGASVTSPVQPAPQSKMQGMMNEYRRLQQKGNEEGRGSFWGSDQFLELYGDAFAALARSDSEYRANINPSHGTWRSLQANKKLARSVDPSVWQAIVGPEGEGAFSTDSYRAMQSFQVANGSSETLIDKKSPKQVAFDLAVASGWRKYNQMMDGLRVVAASKGYDSVAESPDLMEFKRQATAALAKDFPDWADARITQGTFDSKTLPGLRAIADNKKLVNDPGRPEFKLLGEYLKTRDDVTTLLEQRGSAGGSSSIDANSNADIATAFAKFTEALGDSNTVFQTYMVTNLLDRDPYYLEELLGGK